MKCWHGLLEYNFKITNCKYGCLSQGLGELHPNDPRVGEELSFNLLLLKSIMTIFTTGPRLSFFQTTANIVEELSAGFPDLQYMITIIPYQAEAKLRPNHQTTSPNKNDPLQLFIRPQVNSVQI